MSNAGAGPIRRTLVVGERLPDLSLPGVPDGTAVSVRARGREGTVVVLLHSVDCGGCLQYLDRLAASHERLKEWDGRVLAIVPTGLAEVAGIGEARDLPFPLLADPEGIAAARCGVGGGSVLIADQWGELFLVEPGEEGEHGYPEPEEVVEWLRFVAIQCPECQGEAW